ncbi:MAG: adenylate/guanylate cyclase domain-containing protein [bacterium]|nr:adenylate/guanylate cyclase domain-containing protein [bacterium]
MPVFLFSDIEGSTKLWEKYPDEMGNVLNRHDEILRTRIEEYGGAIVKHTGDGVFAVFEDGEPLLGAIEIQKAFFAEEWSGLQEDIRVRVALHSGEAERRGDDYFGADVNKTARLLAVGWGGQILLTDEVTSAHRLPEGAEVEDHYVHILRDLSEPLRIYGLFHPDFPLKEFPPLRSLSGHPNNLPVQYTPFINRKTEIEEVSILLDKPSCRLLTLVGPGGIGKSRLALQVAAERVDEYADGVFFVPLESLESHEFMVNKIADSLNFNLQGKLDPREQLLGYLKEKRLLLLLDNFEHIIEAVETVYDILQAAPLLTILATSRRSLDLHCEWLFEVSGLTIDFDDSTDDITEGEDAAQLFLESVRRVRQDFQIQPGEKKAIVDICRSVEGMPLGIELAATHARILDFKEIAFEIKRNLGFLRTTSSDVPERQQSMKGVFEYSWQLLSEKEKDMLRCISVFSGGFSVEAAEEFVGASVFGLSALMDKSMLRKTQWGRFEIHPVLKQFAEKKLEEYASEKKEIQGKHCRFFADFVQTREDELNGENQARVLAEMDDEIGNIRVGWREAVKEADSELIDKYLHSMFIYYDIKGWFKEGAKAFAEAAEALQNDKGIVYAAVMSRQGMFEYRLGNNEKARKLSMESLFITQQHDDKKERAISLRILGELEFYLGSFDSAEEYVVESRNIYCEIGNIAGQGACLNLLGRIASGRGDFEAAKGFYTDSLCIWEKMGNRRLLARLQNNLGTVSQYLGENKEARAFFLQSLAINEDVYDNRNLYDEIVNGERITREPKKYSKTKPHYLIHSEGTNWIGDKQLTSICLNNLGIVADEMGSFEDAKKLHLESLEIKRDLGYRDGIANSLKNLGGVSTKLKEYKQARNFLYVALQIAGDMKRVPLCSSILLNTSRIFTEEGNPGLALSILTFVVKLPIHPESEREEALELVQSVRNKLAGELSEEEIYSLEEKGRKMDLNEMVEEVLGQLK